MAFFKLLAATVLILASTVSFTDAVPVPASRRDFGANDEALAAASFNSHQVILQPSEYTNWHNETRQRDRYNRIQAIRFQVLQARAAAGRNKFPTGDNFMSNTMPQSSGESAGSAAAVMSRLNAFSGKIQTYSAGCDLMNQADIDDETWTRPGLFHIYFNISWANTDPSNETSVNDTVKVSTTVATPIRRGRAQLPVQATTTAAPTPAPVKNVRNIISAKLRLFKIGQEEVKKEIEASGQNNGTQTGTRAGQAIQTATQPIRRAIIRTPTAQWESASSEKIFVRVYYYLPAVGRRHFRKKLLESKTLTVTESGWIDFDIQNAVKAWTVDEKKNFGLEIEVENDDNELVDVHKYFSNLECPVLSSENSTTDATRTTTTTEPTPVKPTYPSPVIEVRSVSLPAATDNSGVQSYTVPYPMSSFLRQSRIPEKSEEIPTRQNESPLSNSHRHRHHHGDARRSARHSQDQNQAFDTMQSDSPAVEQTTRFTLAENHPLRLILGTASTGPFTNAGRGHRGYIRNHRKSFKQDLGLPESGEDTTANMIPESDSAVETSSS